MYLCTSHEYIGALIGFTDLGDINSHLDEYETQVASKELREPLANFHVAFDGQGPIYSLEVSICPVPLHRFGR